MMHRASLASGWQYQADIMPDAMVRLLVGPSWCTVGELGRRGKVCNDVLRRTVSFAVRSAVRCASFWLTLFQAARGAVISGVPREDLARIANFRSSSAPKTMNGNGISSSRSRGGGTAVPSSA